MDMREALPEIDGYEILHELGRGGMGAVYLARQLSVNRDVALKLLPEALESDPEAVRRFQDESRIPANLKHDNIVTVHDASINDAPYYYAMEFLEKGTLSERLKQGPLPLDETLRITQTIGAALDYAHGKGVVHRDVKPLNIMFDSHDKPVLTDFGIARSDSRTVHTQVGSIFGPPNYMSPEQAKGETADSRSDLYSLAVVAYEMLCGRPPFSNPDPRVTMHQIIYDPPPSIRSFKPSLPSTVDRVFMKALEKLPARRYQSGAEFARELREAIAREEITKPCPKCKTPNAHDARVCQSCQYPFEPPPPPWPPPWLKVLLGAVLALILCIIGFLACPPPPPPEPKVPPLIGKTVKVAKDSLSKAGLQTGQVKPPELEKQPGSFVTSTSPTVGTSVAIGSKVDMEVKGGGAPPSLDDVPDVRNMPAADAKKSLQDKGFTPHTSEIAFHETVAQDHVIRQNPPPGSKRPRGTQVRIQVSQGRGVRVPSLWEVERGEAKKQISAAGLKVGKVEEIYHSSVKKGLVCQSEPGSDAPPVKEGTPVRLWVSKGSRRNPPYINCTVCGRKHRPPRCRK